MKTCYHQCQDYRRQCGGIIFKLIFVAAVAGLAFGLFSRFASDPVSTAKSSLRTAQNAADAITKVSEVISGFNTRTVVTAFHQDVESLRVSEGPQLEVARLEADETFERSESLKTLWDTLHLGTTTAEMKIPATFRYFVELNNEWEITFKKDADGKPVSCTVTAPKLQAQVPVAFDTSAAKLKVDVGWARSNGVEVLKKLWKEITPTLNQRAKENLRYVREPARSAVREFVGNWLMRQQHWETNHVQSVVVQFADEVLTPTGSF